MRDMPPTDMQYTDELRKEMREIERKINLIDTNVEQLRKEYSNRLEDIRAILGITKDEVSK